jgi:hypothetical protein
LGQPWFSPTPLGMPTKSLRRLPTAREAMPSGVFAKAVVQWSDSAAAGHRRWSNQMDHLTFLGLAERVLREQKKPLSPSEIWKLAQANGYDRLLETKGKTAWNTLYSAIFRDARDNEDSIFIQVGERPARYFLKGLEHSLPRADSEQSASLEDAVPEINDYLERDLHAFLAYFVDLYFKAYSKTIRHANSTKKEFGEWVHPDMIAVYYPVTDWKPEVLDLSSATGNAAIKLYSFELKKRLSFANLREAFFQAVSNSSWAHEGYLVAADISTDDDFLSELRRLSGSFGIGIIKISVDDPDASEIMVPARERDSLDWETVNKLTITRTFCRC